jgi:hypothetical protein
LVWTALNRAPLELSRAIMSYGDKTNIVEVIDFNDQTRIVRSESFGIEGVLKRPYGSTRGPRLPRTVRADLIPGHAAHAAANSGALVLSVSPREHRRGGRRRWA